MKKLWRSLTRRRTVTWVGIFGVVAATFIALTYTLPPNAILKPALSWLIALLAWALAVLFWDLAIVWIEYVSESRDMTYLKKVWEVTEAPPERPRATTIEEQSKIWWKRAPRF